MRAIISLLEYDPRVDWVERMNVGRAYRPAGKQQRLELPGEGETVPPRAQWVPFGFEGCSDIIGMLRRPRGVWLAIEVKRDWSEWRSPETFDSWVKIARLDRGRRRLQLQRQFLLRVREGGGRAGIATTLDEVGPILAGENTRI